MNFDNGFLVSFDESGMNRKRKRVIMSVTEEIPRVVVSRSAAVTKVRKAGELMEDQELVVRVKEGDPDAINAIVEAYKGPLYAFILRMTGDRDRADDLFQDTWLRAVKYVRNFRGDSKLSTWLFQIALNLVRDSERKKKRWHMEPIDDFSQSLSHAPDVDPIRMLQAGQVRQMVDELPVKMREVVILRYYHELNDREISEIAGCPEGTVKSRFFRASEIMRKKWTHMQKER